jgi:acyl-CoA thioesterase-1
MIRIAVFLIGSLLFGVSQAEPIQIVAFGGSNTFGKNLSRSEAYPAQLEAMLKAAGYDVVIKNEGTNGQSTSEELSKVNSAIPDGTRIVIFHPGGNDQTKKKFTQFNDTKGNVETIVQTLLDRKILVLLTGNHDSREAVKKFRIPTIKNINQLAPDDFQGDGMHLTANGCRIAAEKMLPYVKELLEKVHANDAQPIVPGNAVPSSGSRP